MSGLIVGAKSTEFPGWLSTDLRAPGARLDIRRTGDWSRYFAPNSIDRIVAEHVLEHMSVEEGFNALCNIATYLKPGGRVRVAVPDAYNPDPAYREHSRPGGKGQAWARLLFYTNDEPEHKVFYDFQSLSELMQRAGLTPHLLEYHDARGVFHRNAWKLEDGPIRRYYNSPYNLKVYAPFHGFQNLSLIIDGVKSSDASAATSCAVVEPQSIATTPQVGRDSTGNLVVGALVALGLVVWLLKS